MAKFPTAEKSTKYPTSPDAKALGTTKPKDEVAAKMNEYMVLNPKTMATPVKDTQSKITVSLSKTLQNGPLGGMKGK